MNYVVRIADSFLPRLTYFTETKAVMAFETLHNAHQVLVDFGLQLLGE